MVRSQAPDLTIAGLARDGGVGVETVRYYQRRGLLPVPHGGGRVRRYGEPAVRRLRFIRTAQTAGFTLDQIGELLALDATHDRATVRMMAERQVAALDARLADIRRARDMLAALARECEEDQPGPCPILHAFTC